ncbi:FecR family protein [Pedobacter glucosidilyticus]|uniref:FecR family protein n=1 Tax=Pedobacter glucosidilyticus TaxID=1122941 RepID=UPI0026EFE48C|nr:FecR family protein [Pedobacter glucosidilyticus]
MDPKEFYKILRKYRLGEASQEEIDFLDAYYNLFEVEENVLDGMQDKAKSQLKDAIKAGLSEQIAAEELKSSSKVIWMKKWLIAASVLLFTGVASYLFFKQSGSIETGNPKVKLAKVEIKPGGNKAVLTLADGSSIILNDKEDGLITQDAGAEIVKTKDGQIVYHTKQANQSAAINMISTPRGGQYQLTLADGTQVWLNASSSIKFPTVFTGAERKVEITGEAYFEVAKNIHKPFKVVSAHQVIEVLGTHFNINTYDDESADKTTLLEGSVRVHKLNMQGKEENISAVLKPGQQAVLANNAKSFKVSAADEEAAIAWKNGYFKFNRDNIQTIMRQVSRWYNVDVEYRGKISEDLFVGKINRSENVTEVLRILELSKINTTIKGNKIIITN